MSNRKDCCLLEIGHASSRGKQRKLNEDRYCAVDLVEHEAKFDCLLAVADGMGGHAKGEVASTYSIRQLLELFVDNRYPEWAAESGINEDNLPVILKEAFQEINAKLYDTSRKKPNYKGMGTTLTGALLRMPNLYICHVGDSRAYLLRKDEMRQLTNDHSWVAEQIRKGVFDENDPEIQEFSNYITQAIGAARTVHVDSMALEIRDGDFVFLCTDGLYELVNKDEIKEALLSCNPQKACDKMIKLANKRGGHDNITCVVAKVETEGDGESPKRSMVRGWEVGLILCVVLLMLALGILYWTKPSLFDPFFDFLSDLFTKIVSQP